MLSSLPQYGTGNTESSPGTKNDIRRTEIAARRMLSKSQLADCGTQLLHQTQSSGVLQRAQTVAAYVSMGSEIPTLPLISWLLSTDHEVLVPRLGSGRDIGWSFIHSAQELEFCGYRRPDEPKNQEPLSPKSLNKADAVLAPAFLVDKNGYRVGRGAGWYDRALLYARPNAEVIGVCFPWEDASKLSIEHDEHDIPVGTVLTPAGFRTISV